MSAPVTLPYVTSRRFAVGLPVGLAGSLLVAVGALGVGALPRGGRPVEQLGWLGIDLLRRSQGARAVSTALSAAGVLLLLGGWLLLRGARPRQQCAAALCWALPLLAAPPVFSRDVYAYAGQGALVAAGIDPYTHGPNALPGPLADSVAPQYAGVPSPYGPVFLTLARLVPGDRVEAAVLLLRALAVVGLLLAAWGLSRLASDPGTALWLGIANPLVLLHGVGGAHNEALMAGLLIAGLAVARERPATAAALVTLAGLVKLPAFAGLAVLPLLGRSRRTAVGTLVTAGAVSAASGLSLQWVHTSCQGVAGPSLLSPLYGLGRALEAFGVPHGLTLATTGGTVVGVAAAVGLLLAAPRLGALRALGTALVVVAALAPAVQPWYLVWGLLPLAAVAGEAVARALAAAGTVLCLALLPSGVPVLHGPTWGAPVLLAAAVGAAAARTARIPA